MSLTRRNLIAVGSGVLTALPAVAWAGNEVWSALKAAERIPVIESRLERQERETEKISRILTEMLMIQHREFGSEKRAKELASELEALRRKEVSR